MLSIKAFSARIRNARLDLTAIIKHLKQYCPEKKKKQPDWLWGNYYISGLLAGTFGTRTQTLGSS